MKKRELYSIFRHWSFSSESKRKLEKFLCEQCIDVCMWRIFFIIFSTLMKKMPRSNWCTTWTETVLNIKLSHLQIDLSYKMFLCIAMHPQRWNNHCQNYENMMHEFRKLMYTQALIFSFLVHFFVENWNIVNEVLNIPLKIDVTKFPCERMFSMCVRVCVTKTFECHYTITTSDPDSTLLSILRFLSPTLSSSLSLCAASLQIICQCKMYARRCLWFGSVWYVME